MGYLLTIIFLTYVQLLLNCSSTGYRSLGCYFLNFSLEASGLLSQSDPLLTYQRCSIKCKKQSLPYFLVYDKYCVCSQSITNYTRLEPGNYCNIPCPGEKRKTCGGSSAVNIFAVAYCKILSKPANGLVEQSTEEATFACLRGYQLHGAPVIHCNKTLLEWDGPSQPFCVKENCAAFKSSTNFLNTEGFISPTGSVFLVVAVVLLAFILLIREICHRRRNNILRVNLPSPHQPADPDNTVQLHNITRNVRCPQMDANHALGKKESKITKGEIPDLNNDTMEGMTMENNTECFTSSCSDIPAKRKVSSSCQSVQSLQDDLVSITEDESDRSYENDFNSLLTQGKEFLKGANKVKNSKFNLFGNSGLSIVQKPGEIDAVTENKDDKDDNYSETYDTRGLNEMEFKKRDVVDTYGIRIEDKVKF
ncbi:hypothetical protein HOLleu_23258 [Holothuria leucospilota]|uniref:WSC domain-containing protein n=1 Tax=Holothuria leucospilota TaxID=206669 RepID=A0A9Q1H2S5_HOLLE|nr:hypothetical protein HOLleu_23258 [Holothuria leucospilota]